MAANKHYKKSSLLLLAFIMGSAFKPAEKTDAILFTHVTFIDGNGGKPLYNADVLVKGNKIAAIGKNLKANNARIIDLTGKTIIPALISDHVHVGLIRGPDNKTNPYTRDRIVSELKKYESYGVGTIMVMGTDRPIMFDGGIRDSSMSELLPGARLHSAGYGFGMPGGAPPVEMGMTKVYRPSSAAQIPQEMDSLVQVKPDLVKLWIDDFNGKYSTKMSPAIYKAIIDEAHKKDLRVAAHVFYLSDARQLINDGANIIAHSIRDSVIDDALMQKMKANHVVYIPTLSLDEYAYIYARRPDWINDPFFKASLEPGVYELITSEKYQNNLKNSPAYAKNMAAFSIALKNLKKIYDAGILVCLGTDSGAMMLRAQGFSEHLELELMVQAGLTPLQALTVATKNSSEMLHIEKQFGTLQKGKIADFIILDGNPAVNIKNTRKILAVYKSGKEVSNGPLSN
ncbi:amidohydrolase family protein [Mucilaginibacter sp.]|uniref:amidohydrolase family protein n=1 Tax=Mucilaginibacter sp. TaxID=1882438 RepID=UPI00262D2AFB|nr:amidohydrolase family protein [Mucilaginibacter sp.]MDB5031286.1 amidohydrolase precursor [Mucilaginibacter sp.]